MATSNAINSFFDTAIPRGSFFRDNPELKNISTSGGSSIYKGRVTLDPRIQALRDERLGLYRTGLNDFTKNQGTLRARLDGTKGALRSARLRPIYEARAQAQQGFGRRGLSGSSLMTNALGAYDTKLADQSAFAEMESIDALNKLDMQGIASIMEVANALGQEGGAWLAQELSSLGLGFNDVERLRNEWENFAAGSRQQRSNIFTAIGQVMGGISGIGSSSAAQQNAGTNARLVDYNMGGSGYTGTPGGSYWNAANQSSLNSTRSYEDYIRSLNSGGGGSK